MADTGSEMSCLTFSPSSACASGIDSRRCHKACDCARLSATTASAMTPASSAAPSIDSRRSRACTSPSVSLCSSSTVHGAAGSGCGRAGKWRATRSSAKRPMTSKPVRPAPSRPRASFSSATHCARSSQAASAVVVAAGSRRQLERCRGDDAERAFAADHQVAQVVAGVVLAQAAQAVPHLAGSGDDLQPQAQLARIAPAQDLRAAGIGGQVAADGATAFRRHAQRQQQPAILRRCLQRLQHAAGFGGEREIGLVEGADAVHALQAQQHLRAAGVGHAAADQAGVAALRHDRHAGFGTGAHHGGHLGRAARPHDGQRAAVPAATPIQFPGRQVARGEHVGGSDGAAQRFQQVSGRHLPDLRRWTAPRCAAANVCTARWRRTAAGTTRSRPRPGFATSPAPWWRAPRLP